MLGTDQLGRDSSRLLYGARISLLVGASAAAMSAVIGTTLGVLGGYFGGRVDLVITFIITTRHALPAVILVALAVAAFIGSSLEIVIAVLGLLLWDRFAVVTRSATMQVRARPTSPRRAVGSSTARIILVEDPAEHRQRVARRRHARNGAGDPARATLSFLGLGIPPPAPSWGLMVAEGKEPCSSAWVITIPGAALFVLVLAINLFGDGLRDIAAPESRA